MNAQICEYIQDLKTPLPGPPTTSTTLQQSGHRPELASPGGVVGIDNKPTTNPLDHENSYHAVDLLRYVPDSGFKRFVIQTVRQCQLPESTVFLNMVGIYASVACRKWAVCYATGGMLPIGLYVVTEQPPGTGKTRCQSIAQYPFFKIKSQLTTDTTKRLKVLEESKDRTDADEAELLKLKEQEACVTSRPFITNATPEAIEKELLATNGYFSAVSSEQGLFNSMLGLSYANGSANNNDLVLHGLDGGYMSSSRVTRSGYHGHVIGGIVLFAQDGSVQKILEASNGTGLAERFLMLCEPHNLGKRNHSLRVHIDEALANEYASRCNFAEDVYQAPISKNDLAILKPSNAGYQMIEDYRQRIEPQIDDGGKFSHIALRGAAAKIDMQILKLAANLWLLTRSDEYQPTISEDIVEAAIKIANELIESNLTICRAKGIIGITAEFKAILRIFECDKRPKSERQIIQSRSTVEPFKSFTGNKSDAIRQALAGMVESGIFAKTTGEGGCMYYLIQ